jgi:hypothetical protein
MLNPRPVMMFRNADHGTPEAEEVDEEKSFFNVLDTFELTEIFSPGGGVVVFAVLRFCNRYSAAGWPLVLVFSCFVEAAGGWLAPPTISSGSKGASRLQRRFKS